MILGRPAPPRPRAARGPLPAAARLPRGGPARRHEPAVAAQDHGLVRSIRRLVPAQGRDARHGHELPGPVFIEAVLRQRVLPARFYCLNLFGIKNRRNETVPDLGLRDLIRWFVYGLGPPIDGVRTTVHIKMAPEPADRPRGRAPPRRTLGGHPRG